MCNPPKVRPGPTTLWRPRRRPGSVRALRASRAAQATRPRAAGSHSPGRLSRRLALAPWAAAVAVRVASAPRQGSGSLLGSSTWTYLPRHGVGHGDVPEEGGATADPPPSQGAPLPPVPPLGHSLPVGNRRVGTVGMCYKHLGSLEGSHSPKGSQSMFAPSDASGQIDIFGTHGRQ